MDRARELSLRIFLRVASECAGLAGNPNAANALMRVPINPSSYYACVTRLIRQVEPALFATSNWTVGSAHIGFARTAIFALHAARLTIDLLLYESVEDIVLSRALMDRLRVLLVSVGLPDSWLDRVGRDVAVDEFRRLRRPAEVDSK